MADLEDFTVAVNSHDVTAEFSDDPRCWRRGHDQRMRINNLARKLPIEVVKQIWNTKMDETFRNPREAVHWYWR